MKRRDTVKQRLLLFHKLGKPLAMECHGPYRETNQADTRGDSRRQAADYMTRLRDIVQSETWRTRSQALQGCRCTTAEQDMRLTHG